MNLNQIINMVLRIFMRKAVNFGVNKGIDMAARRGKPDSEMTPEDHQQAAKARETAQKARKFSQ